jgi:5'-nucleotidase
MHALITNDDGIDAVGLHTLAQVAVDAGLDVTVAAPHTERSGSGAAMSALEADGRLLLQRRVLDGPGPLGPIGPIDAFAVRASPAMIVFVATRGGFGPPPDIVLSGINQGPNTGRSVLHSGTVGAALTAEENGIPGLAVSLASDTPTHWETAAKAAARAVEWFVPRATMPVVLNLNVPDVPAPELRGFRAARLSTFGAVQAAVGERDEGFVTVTYTQLDSEPEPDSDLALLRQGWSTVTALAGPRETGALDLSTLA